MNDIDRRDRKVVIAALTVTALIILLLWPENLFAMFIGGALVGAAGWEIAGGERP